MISHVFSRSFRIGLAVAAALTVHVTASPAQQGSMGIAAVVNEDIITVYDVQTRLGMIIATSGLENTPEIQRRLVPQVIQGLIEERLKMQEARRLEITTTEAEVRGAVDLIEAQNGMAPGSFRQLFQQRGIDMGTLYSQIEADVAWVKVVRQDLARDVSVPPEEVKNVIARLKANQGKPEHLLAEIFLP
ncbi:MAG: SurA N-terminal domain-containing protein, partial [Rhodobacteraceae bacterium]|nr:SurA N-terminal domain-containing protein [Paracoccaceae bacterium]